LRNLNVTGEQLRAARAMARIEQSDLAKVAKVSVDTIKRLERTIGPVSANVLTVNAVTQALEAVGVEFIEENGGGPGVRLRKGSHEFREKTAS
jgi:transcriptional regulator with XRE-family HTH domain